MRLACFLLEPARCGACVCLWRYGRSHVRPSRRPRRRRDLTGRHKAREDSMTHTVGRGGDQDKLFRLGAIALAAGASMAWGGEARATLVTQIIDQDIAAGNVNIQIGDGSPSGQPQYIAEPPGLPCRLGAPLRLKGRLAPAFRALSFPRHLMSLPAIRLGLPVLSWGWLIRAAEYITRRSNSKTSMAEQERAISACSSISMAGQTSMATPRSTALCLRASSTTTPGLR